MARNRDKLQRSTISYPKTLNLSKPIQGTENVTKMIEVHTGEVAIG